MKAKYFNSDESYVVLEVIKEHKNGTLDLGDAEGTLVVGKCPQADAGVKPLAGHAVLIEDKKEEAAKAPKK